MISTEPMFSEIAARYDFLNRLMSFGLDKGWRRLMIKRLQMPEGSLVLDEATGTGDVAIEIARRFPQGNVRVIGVDPSESMLKEAERKAKKLGVEKRISFRRGDALALNFENGIFDFVTIAFGVRNFGNAEQAMREAARVLKPAGAISILEFSLPNNRFIRTLHLFYLRFVIPLYGTVLSRKEPYAYLGDSIERFARETDIPALLHSNGFSSVRAIPLTFGAVSLYIAQRASNAQTEALTN